MCVPKRVAAEYAPAGARDQRLKRAASTETPDLVPGRQPARPRRDRAPGMPLLAQADARIRTADRFISSEGGGGRSGPGTFSGDVREVFDPGADAPRARLVSFDSIDIASSVGGQDVLDSFPQ